MSQYRKYIPNYFLRHEYYILQIQIRNLETGEPCKSGEVGEICVKSPYTMSEYLERPDSTKECFGEDGFMRTGDMGKYDQDGRVAYVDRIKAIIK